MPMRGMSLDSLRKHTELIPLFVCVCVACVGGTFSCLRAATKSPDVAWNKKGDQCPWEAYRDKQYKLYSPNIDYSKVKSLAPQY